MRRGAICIKPLWLAAALLVITSHLALSVQAQVPVCPGLQVTATAKPRTTRKPLTIMAKVRNTGATALPDVGLRVTVPATVSYKRATAHPAIKDGTRNPIFKAPNTYWPRFSLAAGKARIFKLQGYIDECQVAGAFTVEVAAYIAGSNCTTRAAGPLQVGTGARARVGGERPRPRAHSSFSDPPR